MLQTRIVGEIVGKTWSGYSGYLGINTIIRGKDLFGLDIEKEDVYDQLLKVLNRQGGDFQSCQFSDTTYFQISYTKKNRKVSKTFNILNFPSLGDLVDKDFVIMVPEDVR